MQKKSVLLLTAATLLLHACSDDDAKTVEYPADAKLTVRQELSKTGNNVTVYNGGHGSDIEMSPQDPSIFYLLTDRGPNIDGTIADSKIFAVPAFTPQIAKVKVDGSQMKVLEIIELKNAGGTKLTGLPNPAGAGGTGEIAQDESGNTLPADPEGLDPEGLAIAADGSFWVSDEYGPHIVHFDKTGKTIERVNPFGTGTGGKALPKVLAKRRANRGMEGLCITADGKTLAGIMQSTMYNPSKSLIKNKKATRILLYDIATGSTKQFVYMQEGEGQSNCAIKSISNTEFLVAERDGEYPGNGATLKKIYQINIANATDISDPNNGETGKLFGGKTLEELTETEMAAAGITPVQKTLVYDLLTSLPHYAHDKLEGIAIVNGSMLAIVNDDDFGIVGVGAFEAKILPLTNTVDENIVYFVKLTSPLK